MRFRVRANARARMTGSFMANRTHLVVMPGDGIGPEIMAATLHVLREVDRLVSLGLTFEEVPIGFAALKAHGSTLPIPRSRPASAPTA